tara:strand:- start:2634 stop:2945 length:312 start_codon:yes stop_codon:yes gene_type:complete
MCGGGGRPPDRTDEMLKVQREQIAEQKRQYEQTRADQATRQAEQEKIASAPSAPPPSATAQRPAAALEIPGGDPGLGAAQQRRGYGRKRLRTDLLSGSGLQIP